MTPGSIRLVRESWSLIQDRRFDLSHAFYEELFRKAPHTVPLFAGTGMNAQSRKLAEMLAAVVQKLDDDEGLEALLVPLGRRHAEYGVKLRDYPLVGDALQHALRVTLRKKLTPEMAAAWAEAYETVSAIMIGSLDPW